MTIYSIFELSGAISFLSIGLFVLLTNKKSATNFFFFLFCLMCFFWQIGYTICYSTQSSFLAQKFATISCTAVAMTAPLLYYFTVSYIGKRSEEKWAHLAFILIVIQIPFFMFTNLFLEEPFHYFWGYYSNAGPYHPYHLMFWFVIFARLYWLIIMHSLQEMKKSPEAANRAKYMLMAFAMIAFCVQDYLPKYGLEFFPLGFLAAIFFAVTVGYAAFRVHIMDIRVAVSRTGIFLGVYLVVLGVPFLLSFFGREMLQATLGDNWWMVPLGIATLLASLSPFVFGYFWKKTETHLRKKLEESNFDELTGVLLRRMFVQKSTTALAKSLQDEQPCSLLMIDLDHFKEKNDTYGHLVGDIVLVEVAKRLSQVLRTGDILGRYGGEEFILLLPTANKEKGGEIAERLRQSVAAKPIRTDNGQLLEQTISVGVATAPENATDLQDLIQKADGALYAAKNSGRNKVEISA